MMRIRSAATQLLGCLVMLASFSPARGYDATPLAQPRTDPELAAFIATIRAVDNHSHAHSVAPGDSDYDALPLDGIPVVMPAEPQSEYPNWVAGCKARYPSYPYADLSDAHLHELHVIARCSIRSKPNSCDGTSPTSRLSRGRRRATRI